MWSEITSLCHPAYCRKYSTIVLLVRLRTLDAAADGRMTQRSLAVDCSLRVTASVISKCFVRPAHTHALSFRDRQQDCVTFRTLVAICLMSNSHRPPDMTRQCCLCRVRRCELRLEIVWQSLDSQSIDHPRRVAFSE